MQIRRGTSAAWDAASNPVLEPGELGFVTDVGKTAFKIGDTAGTGWDTLPYVNSTYPELDVSAGNDLNTSIVQGRYPLLSGSTYINAPGDFTNTTTDGSSILLVTVPTNNIIIQELTTSLTPCKRWIRAYNATPNQWTLWKRIDTLSASESLLITNLTLTGILTIANGTAALPSLRFPSVANTGIYSAGQNNLSITTGGADRISVGTALTTVSTNLTVTGTLAANIAGAGTALSVGSGTTQLKTTVVNGLLQVSNATAANKFTVGTTRSNTAGLTEIYFNSSPYLKVTPTTIALADDLVWTGTNKDGGATTTIRCDGVPTNNTDLTTKSYVDTKVSVSTFREMMIVSCVGTLDSNFSFSGDFTTGFTSTTQSIVLALSNPFVVTSVSTNPNSNITWSVATINSRKRLTVSAGTWTVLQMAANGAVYHCVRTA